MNRVLQRIDRFWAAEEIPRALGIGLVLVYVSGLGAIGWAAHQRMQAVEVRNAITARQDALRFLAGVVDVSSPAACAVSERSLQRFAHAFDCTEIRVYDRSGVVLASLSPVEVGEAMPVDRPELSLLPESLESKTSDEHGGCGRMVARTALASSGNPAGQFVEAVFEIDAPAGLTGSPSIEALGLLLASTATFLFVYRRLRRHFRCPKRIADNLVHNADCLEQQLQELRVTDVDDHVAECWNKLIDLTLSLEEEVARSTASSELMAALNKSGTGELAEAMVAVPIGILLVTDEGEVAYANAMARRLVGWALDAEGPLSFDDERVTGDGRPIVDCILDRMRGCVSPTLHQQIEVGDGSHYDVQIVPVRTQQDARRHVVTILDVSQQVRADKAREEFVSQVTHELRTPLTNIRAYAETLSSGMFDDPTVITECYNVITKETRRLGRLIEDILSISQLEVGTMQLVLDSVDLRELLTESVRDVRGLAESKNIDIQTVLPPKLDPVRADRDKLAVVFNNLLGNAIKYTPEGGEVVLSCKAGEENVLIAVRDTGIGIADEDHGRIFEKFQRGDGDDVRAETGTGIGLTTALEIARQHNGDITLISKKGEGSTFTVSLPASKRAPALAEMAV